MSDTYKLTVGIEVHAELNTKSKMFCGCKNDPHAAEPNVHICPVCMAHPGSLPSPNKEAIKKVLTVGAAVNGTFATYSEFDRKNYFYPDIPKAYQLSQYEFPFVTGGKLASVALTRIHLEEDTARSQHDKGDDSLVDFNRAGVPLMELVTEPVIHSAAEAATFAKELQLLLKTLGVSDANMERGEMRVEANISVSKTDELGTKVEVKNLNSFKSVELAIAFEQARQIALLEAGEQVVQETRGWDENKERTYSQRVKETADDYRYFPDPDISKVDVLKEGDFKKSRIEEVMPVLPEIKREKYGYLGLTREQIETILWDQYLDKLFAEVVKSTMDPQTVKMAANYVSSDVVALRTTRAQDDMHSGQFVSLMQMVADGKINSRVAKDLLPAALFEGVDPLKYAEANGLLQQSDESAILPVVQEIISEFSEVVAEYKGGKETSIQFLIGQGMKRTKGAANPQALKEIFERELS